MSIELDATLALTAKLQAAEARALAAETALARLERHWEVIAGHDNWALKNSTVLKIVQSVDLTAAREMMRKAGDAETLRTERDEAQQRLRAAIQERMKTFSEQPDFDTFVALKHGVVGAVLQALQDGIISRGKACEALAEVAHGAEPTFKASDVEPLDEDCIPAQEVRQLRTERDELAALVEDLQEAASTVVNTENSYPLECDGDGSGRDAECAWEDAIEQCRQCAALTPPAALAALRQRVRVEVLEEVASAFDEGGWERNELNSTTAALCIRAMKEEK